jgi:DNA-binding transcriptional ArsR family regulator
VTLAVVMQALSDPCRIKIVRYLMAGEGRSFACNKIPLKVSKATRSHHFDVLREAGLIQTQTDGTKCLTSLRKEIETRFPGLLKLIASSSAS